MFKFLKRLSFFVVPAAILFVMLPLFVLYRTGDNFQNIDSIIAAKDKFQLGYRFNESNINYVKWKSITIKPRQDIIAIGSSRVLEFREEMFSGQFYNAGYTIGKITDIRIFLKSIPKEKYPKILIVGLDQWMFNSNFDDFSTTVAPNKWETSYQYYPNRASFRNFYREFLGGDVDILAKKEIIDGRLRVGYNAIGYKTGFNNDGSIWYGDPVAQLIAGDRTFYADADDRIREGNRKFEHGNTVNPKALEELGNLADFCRENNIFLITFFPPYASLVLEKMSASGKYHYMDGLYQKARPILSARGFECYDYTDIITAGSSDNEMIDGFHGSELSYARMLSDMIKKGSKLNAFSDRSRLETDIENKISNYQVYPF